MKVECSPATTSATAVHQQTRARALIACISPATVLSPMDVDCIARTRVACVAICTATIADERRGEERGAARWFHSAGGNRQRTSLTILM